MALRWSHREGFLGGGFSGVGAMGRKVAERGRSYSHVTRNRPYSRGPGPWSGTGRGEQTHDPAWPSLPPKTVGTDFKSEYPVGAHCMTYDE